jgi:hypothetical protein
MPQKVMTGIISVNSTVPAELTKMHSSSQVLMAIEKSVMFAPHETSFFTSWARRKFRKNFNRWSLKFSECGKHLPSEVSAELSNFVGSLKKIVSEQSSRKPEKSVNHVSELESKVVVLAVLSPGSASLLRFFKEADRCLFPVYLSHLRDEISKDEFEQVKAQVETHFKILSDSIDAILLTATRTNRSTTK